MLKDQRSDCWVKESCSPLPLAPTEMLYATDILYNTHFFSYKNNFYKKMSLKKLNKMLRKSPASDAWAAILKNTWAL